jgi:O-antigen/teichoic acid export membrane protein
VVGVVALGGGLIGLTLNWLLIHAVPIAACTWRVLRSYPGVVRLPLPVMTWPIACEYLTRGFWVAITQLGEVLVKGSDLLILGLLLGKDAVVPYAFTGKVLTTADSQIQGFVKAAGPALSELKAGGHAERMANVCGALTQGMLLLTGVLVCGVITLNEGFVSWWVGPNRYGGMTLTALLATALTLRHLNFTALYALFCFGHERRVSLLMLADGVVTVVASFVLVRSLGPVGAAAASILGVVLAGLPLSLTALAAETGVPLARVLGSLWPWLWRTLGVLALAGTVAALCLPDSLRELLLGGMGVVVVYVLALLPVALRPPLGEYVRPRLAGWWAGSRQDPNDDAARR